MTTRKDAHRPSEIIPVDYDFVIEYGRDWVSYDPDFGKDEEWSNMDEAVDAYQDHGVYIHGSRDDVARAILRCDCCGARFKYGQLYRHRASGEVISLGHTCALGMGLQLGAGSVRDRMARERKAVIECRWRREQLKTWAQEHKELLPLLKLDHDITRDMRRKLIRTGAKWGLSTRQVALLHKLVADSNKPEEKHVPVPVDGERIRVEGLVVGLKAVDSDYGTVDKMTVKVETPEGSWLVYGSAPRELFRQVFDAQDAEREAFFGGEYKDLPEDEQRQATRDFEENQKGLKGRRVAFTAKVTRGRDEHFGFFSRPTKSELL